jgi:hypothetical protein
VQKGFAAKEMSARERLYLNAIAALFKDDGAGPKAARDEGYRGAMAIAYTRFPDDETKLFYGLAILGAIREGTRGFERQAQAAKLFEEVYARSPDHPGVLHYLIHAYDDPVHAEQGLEAARRYAKAAAAVPHAMHMPSHIFTRLGYWDESAAANERAWQASELQGNPAPCAISIHSIICNMLTSSSAVIKMPGARLTSSLLNTVP